MTMPEMKPFMKIKDACAVTGLSQFALRRGVRDGSIPHVTVGAGRNCTYYINVPAMLKQLGVPLQDLYSGGGVDLSRLG